MAITIKTTKIIIEQVTGMFDIKTAAKCLYLMNMMTRTTEVQDDFEFIEVPKSLIRHVINPKSSSVDSFLDLLESRGVVKSEITGNNPYNKKQVLTRYILQPSFRAVGFYTFTESHGKLYNELNKIRARQTNYSEALINDDQILCDFVDDIPAEEVRELFKQRKAGESICSTTSKSKNGCGRLNSIYTNMKKSIRSRLYDNQTGLPLTEIDLKNSQFRFFLAFLAKNQKISQEMKNEIEELQQINDIYSFFAIHTGLERNMIKMLMIPMLCGKWTSHANKKHFSDELIEKYKQFNRDLAKDFNTMFYFFDTNFNNITRYMVGVCKKRVQEGKNESISEYLQRPEAQFIRSILVDMKRMSKTNNIQFFSVFDAIFFSTEHTEAVTEIIEEQIKKEAKKGVILKYEVKECATHEPTALLLDTKSPTVRKEEGGKGENHLVGLFVCDDTKTPVTKTLDRKGEAEGFEPQDCHNAALGDTPLSPSLASPLLAPSTAQETTILDDDEAAFLKMMERNQVKRTFSWIGEEHDTKINDTKINDTKIITLDQIKEVLDHGSKAWMYRGTGKQQMKKSGKKFTQAQVLEIVNEKFKTGEWK